jgi:hypothetical protein
MSKKYDSRLNKPSENPKKEKDHFLLPIVRKIFGEDRVIISHTTNTGYFKLGHIYCCGNQEERYMQLFVIEKNSKICSIELKPRKIPLIYTHQSRQDSIDAGLGPYETDPLLIRDHQLKYGIIKEGDPIKK